MRRRRTLTSIVVLVVLVLVLVSMAQHQPTGVAVGIIAFIIRSRFATHSRAIR